MNSDQFVYWLQGFFEIADQKHNLTPQQMQIIKDHLNLVFEKKTPSYPQKITPITRTIPNFVLGEDLKYCSSAQLSFDYKDTKMDVSC